MLGLGIKATEVNQRHCGIIYRLSPKELRFLHLAFHFDLRDEELNGTYSWSSSGLDTDNEQILAALVSVIAEGHPQIPYAFDMDGLVFDKDTGALSDPPPGKGLTCATFVLAVFQTYGFEPLNVNGWQSRVEDEKWQQEILTYMKERGASQEHVDAIEAADENKRFRPEEVVGAAAQTSSDWPIDHDRAQELAAAVLAELAG